MGRGHVAEPRDLPGLRLDPGMSSSGAEPPGVATLGGSTLVTRSVADYKKRISAVEAVSADSAELRLLTSRIAAPNASLPSPVDGWHVLRTSGRAERTPDPEGPLEDPRSPL